MASHDSYMDPKDAARLSIAEQHDWLRARRSRRSVLKVGAITAGAAVAAPALGGMASAAPSKRATPTVTFNRERVNGASVSPFGRRVSFGADPTSEINLAWQVPLAVGSPFVRLGLDPNHLGERIEAETRVLTTAAADITGPVDSVAPSFPTTIEQTYLHVALTHLRPDTTYYYSVGHDGNDQQGTGIASFTTAPSRPQPYTFTAFGDQGISYDAVGVSRLLPAESPAFHLHAGDVAYAEDTGHGLITDSYDPRVWDGWFNQTDFFTSSTPYMVAVGNHEMEAWYSPHGYGGQEARFDFPGTGPSACPATYYFTYGNVAYISLDANDVSYEIPANFGYSDGAQTSWLESTLAALRADDTIDFVVAYFHHCAYSTCTSHGSEGGARQYWAPLFDKYSVDLVINGHNHIYERTDPIIGGSPTTTVPAGGTVYPATQGTTYVATGGAGDSLYAFSAPDSYEGETDNVEPVAGYYNGPDGEVKESVEWSQVRFTGYEFIAVDVQPPSWSGGTTTLTIRTISEIGTEIDRVVLERTHETSGRRHGK
jgi:hypothetical protein